MVRIILRIEEHLCQKLHWLVEKGRDWRRAIELTSSLPVLQSRDKCTAQYSGRNTLSTMTEIHWLFGKKFAWSQGGRSWQAFIEYKLKLFFYQGHISYIGEKNCTSCICKLLQKGIFWNGGSCVLSKVSFLHLWMPKFYSWHFSPNLMNKFIIQYTDDSTLWMQFVFTYKI